MNIGIFLGHPAHFHMLKHAAKAWTADGHKVFFAIKQKDILEQLLKDAGFEYTIIREGRGKGKISMMLSVLKMEWRMCKFLRRNKIDVLIGTTLSFAARYIARKPVVVMNEDDAAVVPLYAKIVYPFASNILAPVVCNNGKWDTKSTKYPGYHELAYLHPNHFTPDPKIVEAYGIDTSKPYFVMRFASLNAHHDSGIKGINTEIAERLVKILEPFGTIYITSERPLEPQFEKYRIKINPLDMHHVMAFASLYIGDSQTMAAEAGVLGVPFVRFNDFVGRIGYLRELEDVYELGYGIHASVLPADSPIRRNDGSLQPSGVEELYKRVEQLVTMPSAERRELFQQRRQQMLNDKIDCAKFLTWFIEEWPKSGEAMKAAPKDAGSEFWKKFK